MGEINVEATAGGGMVTVKMNGQKQLTEVHIEPEVFASKDQEMLQDLLLAAVNEATRRVDEEMTKQVKDMTGEAFRNRRVEDSRAFLNREAIAAPIALPIVPLSRTANCHPCGNFAR